MVFEVDCDRKGAKMEQNFKISLEAARVNVGLKQSEAAKQIGVTKQTLVNWEKGRTAPTMPKLMKLCDVYSVPLDCISLLKVSAI